MQQESLKPGTSGRFSIVAVVLVIATMAITHYRNVQSRESARWVNHTYEVINAGNYFLNNLSASEAFQLNQTVPFDSSGYSVYRSMTSRVDTLVRRLRSLTIDNPSQTSILDNQIIRLLETRRKRREGNWHYGSDGSEIYRQNIRDKNGIIVLDSINYYTAGFIQNEEALLVARNQKVQADYLINDILRLTFLTFIGSTCLAAFFTIRRQQGTNTVLVNNLEEANVSLESKVQSRTEELSAKNQVLNESMEEIRVLHESLDLRNKRLEESLGEVQFLYDQAPCGYHTVDAHGIIIKINKTELDWLGYTEEEVAGKKNASELLTPRSAEERNRQIELLKSAGKLDNLEFELVRKDGSVFPALLNMIAYFDSDGKYVKNRSSVFDISQRKQLEIKFEKANAYLTLLNEEKNRFIGIATHDLKNPINGIFGLVQLLKRSNNLNEEQHEYIGYIEASIAKMNALIAKLLDLNRIEQFGSIVRKQPVDLRAFLSRTRQTFIEQAKKKSIEMILENLAGPIEFNTDPALLEQIIDNLISNAIKFSDSGKKMWLRIKQTERDQLTFEVEDQGPGIMDDEIPKLFGVFQCLSAKPTGGETSSGLGLSIVKGMVKVLGAEITLNSVVGRGTTFRVVI
jgi:PAS domain S-box-containing protein